MEGLSMTETRTVNGEGRARRTARSVPATARANGTGAERPLRIAQVAPLYEAVPPGAYGGTERVVATLCDGLVAQGHDVTLFAPETSSTAARLEAFEKPLRERFDAHEMANVAPHLHLEMMAELAARADDFDVIHSHLDLLALPFTRLITTPTVLTLHGRLDLDFVRELLPRYGSVPLVSISDDQRRAVEDLDLTWAATVHNGLDLDHYRDVPHDPDGYLGFVGRIAHEKGPLTAIEVSRRTGVPLRLAAKVDPTDVTYYQEEVAPQMGSHVRFVGEITEDEKPTFYACARATLFPSDWPEPFGLGDDRVAGRRHPGDRASPRLRARGDRGRRHGLHLRRRGRDGRRRRQDRRDRPGGVPPRRRTVQRRADVPGVRRRLPLPALELRGNPAPGAAAGAGPGAGAAGVPGRRRELRSQELPRRRCVTAPRSPAEVPPGPWRRAGAPWHDRR